MRRAYSSLFSNIELFEGRSKLLIQTDDFDFVDTFVASISYANNEDVAHVLPPTDPQYVEQMYGSDVSVIWLHADGATLNGRWIPYVG